MVSNKQIIYAKRPTGLPEPGEHLVCETGSLDLDAALGEGEFIVKTLEFSIDPYSLARMMMPPQVPVAFHVGVPIKGVAIAKVVKSRHSGFQEGDLVYGDLAYAEYVKLDDAAAKQSHITVRNEPKASGLPLSNYVGAMGLAGLTAFVGLNLGNIKAGQTIFVSSASGAVGQIACQVAKVRGLKVVGSAGSDSKCAFLRDLGVDGTINYKTEDIDQKLAELCPEGIDVYFDNVGGATLDTAFKHMNDHGRVIACGMISAMKPHAEPYAFKNIFLVVVKSIQINGFVVNNYMDQEAEMLRQFESYLRSGQIRYVEDSRQGLDAVPQALHDVFTGKNQGKLVVHVSDI
ncbi:hypothetical protein BC940DRAFT_234381 [Gongronella butleri]|nr:hypothetical protein BC940DRAFT_234381 [Gongronella butleri]